jgi:hypothetical protein
MRDEVASFDMLCRDCSAEARYIYASQGAVAPFPSHKFLGGLPILTLPAFNSKFADCCRYQRDAKHVLPKCIPSHARQGRNGALHLGLPRGSNRNCRHQHLSRRISYIATIDSCNENQGETTFINS